jgi:hypothetical protein
MKWAFLVQSATLGDDVAVRKCEKLNNDGHCSGVAVAQEGAGKKEHHGQSGSPFEARPATNGGGAPGKFLDAQGKPTDNPEDGYYGRSERQQVEDAYEAALAEPQRRYVISDRDAEHCCDHYREIREEKGEAAADRSLRSYVQSRVPANKLKREFERIKQMAGVPPDHRPALLEAEGSLQ